MPAVCDFADALYTDQVLNAVMSTLITAVPAVCDFADALYTDRVLHAVTTGQPKAGEGACGRPLGIRVDGTGYLVVADAYRGIVQINPRTGTVQHFLL